MARCTRCSAEMPEDARYCPMCGGPAIGPSLEVTKLATPEATGASATSSSRSRGRFVAGSVLAERYRVVDLIGAGGMGEVYRAEDLKLGQVVALKFLPAAVERDPLRLDRLLGEVRLARQISHPNVCRVYDIGEAAGRHFLTMEFVDGEDLASLLRRVGHLPKERAIQVARQLCAGLAAAHDQGILHRDLKPANVMIDGRGRARITDFGLAVLAEDAGSGETIVGTPAYMAPEQRAGREVTVRSDLYALGLVLYELFTGKAAFAASSLTGLDRTPSSAPPPSPSSFVEGFDPAVERAILRCLEPDPRDRPSSAFEVAVALPGGDPLAAALAAGETPSPEMVAAAGGEGALSPRRAWAFLGGTIVLAAGVLAVSPFSKDLGLARWTKPPAVLEQRVRDLVAGLGYDRVPLDSEVWLGRDYQPMLHLAKRQPSPVWRREIAGWGPLLLFVYRQSPKPLVSNQSDGRILPDDPPHAVSGMVSVTLTGGERLSKLHAVPPQWDTTAVPIAPVDWDPLFQAAGLERDRFRDVTPEWVPPVAADERAEWSGEAPWLPDLPLRVSAAAWRGRPVYFEVRPPWAETTQLQPPAQALTLRIAQGFLGFLITVCSAMGIFLAVRNTKLGRGDRRGAVRLGLFVMISMLLSWALGAHHVASFEDETGLYLHAVAFALLSATLFGVLYLAFEPYVRRRTPELLIGWARLLEGRFTDPRVGRDLLTGALFGAGVALIVHVTNGLPAWIPLAGQTTIPADPEAVAGGLRLFSRLAVAPVQALAPAFLLFGAYFLLRMIFRRWAIAVAALALVASVVSLGGENVLLETPGAIVIGVLWALVIARFGLLAAVGFQAIRGILEGGPLPLDLGAAYATSAGIVLLLATALVLYAFRISLGSRPMFRLTLDD